MCYLKHFNIQKQSIFATLFVFIGTSEYKQQANELLIRTSLAAILMSHNSTLKCPLLADSSPL